MDNQLKVVIINGSGGVGKDEFVKQCGKFVRVENFSSVDVVKEAARILRWDGTKDERSRAFLSDLKDLSTHYNDCPFQSIARCVEQTRRDGRARILFLHIREPKEIQRAKEAFDAATLLILRPSVEEITSNHADAEVTNYKYDYVVVNDGGLDELEMWAIHFIGNLLRDRKEEIYDCN